LLKLHLVLKKLNHQEHKGSLRFLADFVVLPALGG
jgi:hypothetical protein